MKQKVNVYTIKGEKMKLEPINQTKKMFMILGLLSLAIAIPLTIFALIQPEGAFETRRDAAEDSIYYGYLSLAKDDPFGLIPTEFRNDQFYYFAKNQKEPINYGLSETAPKYIIVSKTNIEEILNASETIDETKVYSLQKVNSSNVGEYTTVDLVVVDESSLIEEVSNTAPSITQIGALPTVIKVGQTFSINFKIEEPNNELGDLIQKYSVTGKYTDDTPLSDDNWDIETIPYYQDSFNEDSPFLIEIKGTPPSSASGKELDLSIMGMDLTSSHLIINAEFDIKENEKPNVQIVEFYQDETFQIGEDKHLFRTIFRTNDPVFGKIKIIADDPDDTTLTYSFSDIPSEFKNVTQNENIIDFQINWEDLESYYNSYSMNVAVSDGIDETVETIQTGAIKAYAENDPENDWSADFDYSIKEGSHEVTFTRRDSLIPSNSEIDTFWWIFGDGVELHGDEIISHTFPSSGDYEISLVIIDNNNAGLGLTKTINIPPIGELKAPTASFVVIPQIGNVPLIVKVNPTASSDEDGNIIKYSWDFGDGQNQEHNRDLAFEHTYNSPGLYTITLTVEDNDGLTSQESSKITAGSNNTPSVLITKPNQGVYGGSSSNPGNKISWFVADAENDTPLTYKLYLVESQTGGSCTGGSTKGATNYLLSSGNIQYSGNQYLPSIFEWDTNTSKSGAISDGYYCIKINVIDDIYGQLSTDYSDNPIEISNAQHAPYITTEYLPNAIKDEYYSTKINAFDEDEDSITFELDKGPEWMELTEEGEIKGTPTETGPQTIILNVTDGSTKTTKVYNLNVKETQEQTLPSIILGANIKVFVGNTGIINWSIENGESIDTLELQYSTNGELWKNIASGLTKETTEYNWNISNIEQGSYQIQILYYDVNELLLGASSIKEIEISKPETQNESESIVYGYRPTNGEQLTDKTPIISANFKAQLGSSVDLENIRVYLDNEPIYNKEGFESFEGGFAYIVPEELTVGEHSVKAGFRDSKGSATEERWSFEIIATNTETQEDPREKVSIYVVAIITIIALSGVTLATYFIIKNVGKPRSAKTAFITEKKNIKKPLEIKENQEKEIDEKIFRNVRVTLENEKGKLNLSQEEALKQLKEKEIVKKDDKKQDVKKPS